MLGVGLAHFDLVLVTSCRSYSYSSWRTQLFKYYLLFIYSVFGTSLLWRL